jgi:DNA polymerase-3 subunit gamma/tau
MKPEERQTIESVFRDTFQRDIQVLALLRSDWETFQRMLNEAEQAAAEEPAQPASDIVERAKQLFPEEIIEIRAEE